MGKMETGCCGAAVGASAAMCRRRRWEALAALTFFVVACIAVGADCRLSTKDKKYLKEELGAVPDSSDLQGKEKDLLRKTSTARKKGILYGMGAGIGVLSSLAAGGVAGGIAHKFKGEKAVALKNGIALLAAAALAASIGVGVKALVEKHKGDKAAAKYAKTLVKLVKKRRAEEAEEEKRASLLPSSKVEDDDVEEAAATVLGEEGKTAERSSGEGEGVADDDNDGQEGMDSPPSVEEVAAQMSKGLSS